MTTITLKKARYFYGWNIVESSFLAHLAYAKHHSSILGFFFRPFYNEFSWRRSAISAVQMKDAQGVTEQLKAENAMLWVGKVNNIRACADEITRNELIYD